MKKTQKTKTVTYPEDFDYATHNSEIRPVTPLEYRNFINNNLDGFEIVNHNDDGYSPPEPLLEIIHWNGATILYCYSGEPGHYAYSADGEKYYIKKEYAYIRITGEETLVDKINKIIKDVIWLKKIYKSLR